MTVYDVMEANDWDSDKAIQSLLDEVELLKRQRIYWRNQTMSEVGNYFQTIRTAGAERAMVALDERAPKS